MKRKLSEYRSTYEDRSETASKVARSAAYAGIALIWVFRVDHAQGATLPHELVFPTAMFACALALDVLQYVVGTLLWWGFFRFHEARLKSSGDDPELDHIAWLPLVIWTLFWSKLGAVALGYYGVGRYILKLWSG